MTAVADRQAETEVEASAVERAREAQGGSGALYTLHVEYGRFDGAPTFESFETLGGGTSERDFTFVGDQVMTALPDQFTFAALRNELRSGCCLFVGVWLFEPAGACLFGCLTISQLRVWSFGGQVFKRAQEPTQRWRESGGNLRAHPQRFSVPLARLL